MALQVEQTTLVTEQVQPSGNIQVAQIALIAEVGTQSAVGPRCYLDIQKLILTVKESNVPVRGRNQ